MGPPRRNRHQGRCEPDRPNLSRVRHSSILHWCKIMQALCQGSVRHPELFHHRRLLRLARDRVDPAAGLEVGTAECANHAESAFSCSFNEAVCSLSPITSMICLTFVSTIRSAVCRRWNMRDPGWRCALRSWPVVRWEVFQTRHTC